MSFTSEGNPVVSMLQVTFADPKWEAPPNAFDICIEVQNKANPAESDWWRGEWSSKQVTVGKHAGQMQWQVTLETLRKLGYQGDDLSTLPVQLMGKDTTAWIKARTKDGQTYYDVKWLGGSDFSPKAIDPAEMVRRASMVVGQPAQAAPAPAAAGFPGQPTAAPGFPAPAAAPAFPAPAAAGFPAPAGAAVQGGVADEDVPF